MSPGKGSVLPIQDVSMDIVILPVLSSGIGVVNLNLYAANIIKEIVKIYIYIGLRVSLRIERTNL